MNWRYTPDQLAFICGGYQVMQVPELTAAFNAEYGLRKTPLQIKSVITKHGFTCGRRGTPKGTYKVMTRQQAAHLEKLYAEKSARESAAEMNSKFGTSFTEQQIKSFVKNHGLTGSNSGQFTEGHTPWNAGTKGKVKINSGCFTKGSVPPNRRPVGSERVCSKDGYILVKIKEANPYTGSSTRYKHKHVYMWEQANGPVPAGMVVSFIDGNKTNCMLENLELITRGELARLNQEGFSAADPELRPAIRAMAKLKQRAHDRMKEGSQA